MHKHYSDFKSDTRLVIAKMCQFYFSLKFYKTYNPQRLVMTMEPYCIEMTSLDSQNIIINNQRRESYI